MSRGLNANRLAAINEFIKANEEIQGANYALMELDHLKLCLNAQFQIIWQINTFICPLA
jgi:hypothetical protein